MAESKTARASAVKEVREKKVIPDEVYIKNLRTDIASGLYPQAEGAKALLRAYDALIARLDENSEVNIELGTKLRNCEAANEQLKADNQGLNDGLDAAKLIIEEETR